MSMSIKKLYSTKKAVAVSAAVALTLGIAGAAFAYFTGAGAGNGNATVGSTSTWLVAQTNTTGTMYPGYGSSTLTFTATNNGPGGVEGIDFVSQVVPTMVSDGSGDVYNTTTSSYVTNCLASWFTPVLDPTGPTPAYGTSVAHGSAYTIPVDVTMADAVNTNQDACKTVTPQVTLTISHS